VHVLDLGERLAAFRARGPVTIRREKEGKVNVLALSDAILDLAQIDGQALRMTLALNGSGGGGASVRPDDVLREIFGERAARMRTVREELLVEHEGALVDPMLAATASGTPV